MAKKIPLPDITGISKIMFLTEGNPAAILVSNRDGHRSQKAMQFATAEAALGWCRAHGSALIYLPASPARN